MTVPALIGVDWGSSSVRALCIAPNDAILDVRRADDGVFAASGDFAEVPVSFDRPAYIVPGVSFASGDDRDVMRGEETLLMGLDAAPSRVAVCLPGTHKKWVDLMEGRIVSFRTYMSGELRALLLAAGTLAPGEPQAPSAPDFLDGLLAARGLSRIARRMRSFGTGPQDVPC